MIMKEHSAAQSSGAQEKARITALDLRMVISVMICYLTATVLNHFGIKFQHGNYSLEIIQTMTSCIGCLLVCQDSVPASKQAGINRLIITAIGGILAIVVSLIDTVIENKWLLVLMVGIGVLLTLYFCKLAGVPFVNCRIGALTFILVSSTLAGTARVWYGVFRLLSTLYGVIIVLLVTWIFEKCFPGQGGKNA